MKTRTIMILSAALLLCGCADSSSTEQSDISVTQSTATSSIPTTILEDTSEPTVEITEFSSITATRDIRYGNSSDSLNGIVPTGFVCRGDDGELYFTDLGNTNHIFMQKNGVMTELMPRTGSCLNLWEGDLYFISNTDDPVGILIPVTNYCGDIWRYDLETGESELFYEGDVYSMMISEYGIDMRIGTQEKETHPEYGEVTVYSMQHYRMDFDGNITEKKNTLEAFGVYYGEHELVTADDMYCWHDTLTGEYVLVVPTKDAWNISQNGEWLTWTDNGKYNINALNIATGERKYCANMSYIYDYVWLNGELLVSSDGAIYSIGEGTAQKRFISGIDDVTALSLFTDGKDIYGLSPNGRLLRYELDSPLVYTPVTMWEVSE